MDDWLWMTAADLGRGIADGRVNPVALTDTYLAAIDDHAEAGRIYARTTPDRARAEAKAAAERAASGRRLSLLDGVPISWKDLFDSAGTATESGSKLLEGIHLKSQHLLILEEGCHSNPMMVKVVCDARGKCGMVE